jgi:hypothetical protein
VRKVRLGGQEASGNIETLLDSFARCDLLIDATADATVFNYLCSAVAVAKKPLLWAEVFGGGFGGLIARHRPTVEPDPATMRRAIEQWCAERHEPIPRGAQDYGGGADLPAIADDADVSVMAAHATRLAIDTLIGREPSMFPYSVYVIGLTKSWIFDQPFETHPINVGRPLPEPEKVLDEAVATIELARIKRLFEEYTHASSVNTSSSEAPSS